MDIEIHIKKTVLASQYRMLSELSEHFPKKSVHPVAKIIDSKMSMMLEELQKIHKDETDKEVLSAIKYLINEK
jgi:hypothetical protein